MRRPQSFRAPAGDAEGFRCVLDRLQDYGPRNDQPVHNHILNAATVEYFLPSKSGEAEISIANILRADDAGNVHVRHNGRFHKHETHFDDPSARRGFAFSSPAEGKDSSFRTARATPLHGRVRLSFCHSKSAVNQLNARLHGTRKAFIAARSYAVAA